MHHELKIARAYFEAVISGIKPFEIRKNDRGYQTGDTVTLREWDDALQNYTNREYSATIGYVSAYEQQPGYVVFSLLPTKQHVIVRVEHAN